MSRYRIVALLALAAGGGCSDNGSNSTTASFTAPENSVPVSATSTTNQPTSVIPVDVADVTSVISVDTVEVTNVIDGDTFDVVVDGAPERVRLIGIDAPEAGECMSAEAGSALSEVVADGVQLTADVEDRDQYGRLLRYVDAGGVFVNEELVRRGLALARRYPPNIARQDGLGDAQAEAIAAQRGIWNPAACGPATTADLEISNMNADPPGDDTLHLDGEWVEIANRGAIPVDLTGWMVRDESASHRFGFPDGFTLASDDTVRLHTGCGEPSATDLYWCVTDSAVWNNNGDTVFVLDPNGNIVVSRSY